MRDRGVIVGGLVLFLALLTFPVWYNLAAGTPRTPPQVTRPAGKDPFGSVEFMRASHMDLLMTWRDEVVRKQERTVVGLDGKTYAKSLTRTCLGCHARKDEFCDRCHAYASVTLTCWECHVEPRPVQQAAR